jgi:hypothetical protein
MDWIFLFVVTVWKMRQAQKAYFTQGRKMSDLVDAKRFEKLVDEELIKRLVFAGDVPAGIVNGEELRVTDQPNLFDGDDNEAK